jgi:hypothetical protein
MATTQFTVPEDGQYRVWTCDPARRVSAALADGVVLGEESSTLPDRRPKVEIVAELPGGAVITTRPADAPLIVRRTDDGTALYDNTGDA